MKKTGWIRLGENTMWIVSKEDISLPSGQSTQVSRFFSYIDAEKFVADCDKSFVYLDGKWEECKG